MDRYAFATDVIVMKLWISHIKYKLKYPNFDVCMYIAHLADGFPSQRARNKGNVTIPQWHNEKYP